MTEDYKAHKIQVCTWRNPNGWTPDVQITDLSKGDTVHTMPLRLPQTYATEREAEQAGLSVAKKWIDNEKSALS